MATRISLDISMEELTIDPRMSSEIVSRAAERALNGLETSLEIPLKEGDELRLVLVHTTKEEIDALKKA